MSISESENQTVFTNMSPFVLYNQVNKAYEEYKHHYQKYDSSKSKVYQSLFTQLVGMYNHFIRIQNSDPIYLKLIQEIAQFILELEISPYL